MSATLKTSLGELAVTGSSYLRLFGRGNWCGVFEMASASAPAVGSSAVVAILPEAKPNLPPPVPDTFAGTVRHARQVPGSQTLVVRVVGGAGRLFASLPPDDQIAGSTVLPAGLVLAAIVKAAGEQLAPGVEAALDAYRLPRWHRAGGTSARDAIDLLIYDLAASTGLPLGWRMTAAGTIWAGLETYPPATGSYLYTDQEADDGEMVYAPSGAPLRPGTTVQSDRAIEVTYQLGGTMTRALVRHAVPGDPPPGPEASALALYRASYGARVQAQRPDGTLDLVCDDARMGSLLAVPFRLGIPGVSLTFPAGLAGARVRLRFQDGSPRGAYACDVDQDATASHALALVGDSCGSLLGIAPPGGGPVVFSLVPAGTPDAIALSVLGPGHKWAKGVSA